jgi:hypothetical protein
MPDVHHAKPGRLPGVRDEERQRRAVAPRSRAPLDERNAHVGHLAEELERQV